MIIMVILKILAVMANLGDYCSTVLALDKGFQEKNPFARFLFKYHLAIPIKVILATILIWKIDNWFIIFPIIIFGYATIHNYRAIKRWDKWKHLQFTEKFPSNS